MYCSQTTCCSLTRMAWLKWYLVVLPHGFFDDDTHTHTHTHRNQGRDIARRDREAAQRRQKARASGASSPSSVPSYEYQGIQDEDLCFLRPPPNEARHALALPFPSPFSAVSASELRDHVDVRTTPPMMR